MKNKLTDGDKSTIEKALDLARLNLVDFYKGHIDDEQVQDLQNYLRELQVKIWKI